MSRPPTIERLLRQQAALAEFGSFAFAESNLQKILDEAARICAACLDVPLAKICRYRAKEDDLLVTAGFGWQAGVVGCVVSAADESSTQGRAFVTGEPVILADVAKNQSYALPSFYAAHGVVATADVLIKGRAGPWGVLEVDSREIRKFDRHDVVFLTGFANVVAEAAVKSEQILVLRAVIEKKDALLVEKDNLMVERDARERQLHEAQAEILRVARLNDMGQMTSAIAHELNQPLSAISNYLAAARRTLQSGLGAAESIAKTQEVIKKAADQTMRAAGIIKNLRRFVEKRESTRTDEDISKLIERSLALANYNALDEGVDVTLRLDAALPPVTVDAVQVQQVLINLIRNSVEAMRPQEKRRLLVVAEPGVKGFANVTVQDSGPGLSSDISQHLFEPFVTSKESGMGMGLTICDTLVKANGGRIWLKQGLAEGTGFCFSLPLAA